MGIANNWLCHIQRHRRRGFISMVAFILLVLMGIIGLAYWSTSRIATDQILKESHRIKARNLAQAAVEKVRIHIVNQYTMGNFDVTYPGKFNRDRIDQEFKREFGDGTYWVESVKPWTLPGTSQTVQNLDYYKNRIKVGVFDIWEVVAIGEVPGSGIRARIRSLVKVVRMKVQY